MPDRDFFAFSDPVQHYLTATGRTLFKGLPFEELKRMQLEVLAFENSVAGVGDPGTAVTDRGYSDDHLMSIALSDHYRLGRTDRCRSKQRRRIREKRAQATYLR